MSQLSPLDMMFLSSDEQKVLRHLNRHPRSSFAQVAEATQIATSQLEELLTLMVRDAGIVEQFRDGQRSFSVRFASVQKRVRNMPIDMAAMFAQEPDSFLTEAPLTSELCPDACQRLLQGSKLRSMLSDEVLAWQGKPLPYVGIVRNGLVKRNRLRGQGKSSDASYLRRYEWFGLTQLLGDANNTATFTAVTDGELMVWSADFFLKFLQSEPAFCLKVGQMMAQQVVDCQASCGEGQARLWVLEGILPQTGVSTVAQRLARRVHEEEGARVVLWNTQSVPSLAELGEGECRIVEEQESYLLSNHASGVDVLMSRHSADYPPQVVLDMLLNQFGAKYDYIICDTGSSDADELSLRLRAHAPTLITLATDIPTAEPIVQHWNRQQGGRPSQKRMAVLNKAQRNADLSFHLTISDRAASPATFTQQIEELQRRLSLTHSIGIFIPSTLDVDMSVDNTQQVQQTLNFLGSIFGGATSSNAEGVWQSEESGMVVEEVTIVRTFVSQQALERNLDSVIGYATELKLTMKQEAVAVDIDNQLLLV